MVSREKIEAIIQGLADGGSLKKLLESHKIKHLAFYTALGEDVALETAYVRAQEAKAEGLADEIVEISDTDLDPQRARNRIDARRWYASKIRAGKYGDRLDVNVNQTISIAGALSEARSRAALPVRDLEIQPTRQAIEIAAQNPPRTTGLQSVSPSGGDSDEDIFS